LIRSSQHGISAYNQQNNTHMFRPLTRASSIPSSPTVTSASSTSFPFLDFFAGSGLVTEALKPYFTAVWANDICEKKAAVYRANHPRKHFQLGSIDTINGASLPSAILSWASFPCQDLSLAGNLAGITSRRSGLVWRWLHLLDKLPMRPPLVVAENVVGLISARQGKHYRLLHAALVERGYRVGALLIDAIHWTPQSRPRVFVVGVDRTIDTKLFQTTTPHWAHPRAIQQVAGYLSEWTWWRLPPPPQRRSVLASLIDLHAPCHDTQRTAQNLSLLTSSHRRRLVDALRAGETIVPGYKRTRNGKQVLELRFDGIAGCLRTPEGGSSRQLLIVSREGKLHTRLLTVQETARLMGAPSHYKIPGSYNDGYKAMGDAVSVHAVRYLARHLLFPLAQGL
jgi:DNA (cytosine-5)-methyltransferase 1